MSAGELWVNVVSKGGAGFVAGLAGRHLAHITPMVLLIGLVSFHAVESRIPVLDENFRLGSHVAGVPFEGVDPGCTRCLHRSGSVLAICTSMGA